MEKRALGPHWQTPLSLFNYTVSARGCTISLRESAWQRERERQVVLVVVGTPTVGQTPLKDGKRLPFKVDQHPNHISIPFISLSPPLLFLILKCSQPYLHYFSISILYFFTFRLHCISKRDVLYGMLYLLHYITWQSIINIIIITVYFKTI